mmetsp:Transcript_30991/g.51597  ORF Transcript_30991/g.51597 Transcript_30991/m.51597 type:complete len:341 (+) Transcript_30991:178-1200(+)
MRRPFSPVMSDDESIEPPPSPPSTPPPDNDLELYDAENADDMEELEHTLSEHENVKDTDVFDEEYDSNRRAARKKALGFSCLIVLFLVIAAIAAAASMAKKGDGNQNTVAGSISAEGTEVTDSKVEVYEDEEKDYYEEPDTEAPYVYETKYPYPEAEECTYEIYVDGSCYEYGDTVEVSFTSCDPGYYDWVGFYSEGSSYDGLLYPDFKYWEYTCGGHETCDEALSTGTVSIGVYVRPGSYEFHLVPGSSVPYESAASSVVFTVAEKCDDYEEETYSPTYEETYTYSPTKEYEDKTMSPTKEYGDKTMTPTKDEDYYEEETMSPTYKEEEYTEKGSAWSD